jgi:hypothetical protein
LDEVKQALSVLNSSALRIDKGDTIIALSEKDEDRLLFPSALLRSFSRFEAMLHPRWSMSSPEGSRTVTESQDSDATQITLHYISLQYVDAKEEAHRC